MSRQAGGTTVLLVGAVLIRLTISDAYQKYVRVGMGPWLLVAGVLLVALGLATLVAAWRRGHDASGDGHDASGDGDDGSGDGHDHVHGVRVGWLLLGPVLALLLVTPPALGSYGVARAATGVTVRAGGETFAPLPAAADPRPMTLLEFTQRSQDRSGASFAARPVVLTGFVADPADGGGVRIARYQIACCAADAVAAVVRIVGAPGPAPGRDAWVRVTGTFRAVGEGGFPELSVTSLQPATPPVDPYE